MHTTRTTLAGLAFAAFTALSGPAMAEALKLSGDHEVPPVQTSAHGSGDIKVANDGSISGKVTTSGLAGTAAHIHVGAPGANGPVAVPLTKSGDNDWVVPDGTKLTPEQLKSYQAGNLYVNVHSAANPGGEVRAQLKP